MKVITFDIETIPDESRRGLIEPMILERIQTDELDLAGEALLNRINQIFSITPEYFQIISLAYAVNDQPPRSAVVGQLGQNGDELTEADLLSAFWKILSGADSALGYNCLSFDLPGIKTRSAMLGIAPTRPDWIDLKPWESKVVDLYKKRYPAGSNGVRGKRLLDLARIHQVPIPVRYRDLFDSNVTGADVLPLYQDGALEVIQAHNELDVILTRELARLWGGFFCPILFVPWDDYNYQTGDWTGEKPEGF